MAMAAEAEDQGDEGNEDYEGDGDTGRDRNKIDVLLRVE